MEESKKSDQKTIEDPSQKIKGTRALSPRYYITPMNPGKFTHGILWGNKIALGKSFDQDLDGKIKIYEDVVNGWFLDHARRLIKEMHSDFVILMICTSYLEGNQQFKEGKSSDRRSNQTIRKALKSIFHIPRGHEPLLNLFIKNVRKGLFHDGMTRNKASLCRDFDQPILFDKEFGGMIKINPVLFFCAIEEDFREYINKLKNPGNKKLRKNFEKHWNAIYGIK